MKKGLLLDEPGPPAAAGGEGQSCHQGQEGLTRRQGTVIGEAQEFLATLRCQGGPGLAPLPQPFAVSCDLRSHFHPPCPGQPLTDVMIYDPKPFINPSVVGKGVRLGTAVRGAGSQSPTAGGRSGGGPA
jgi:hypothetical protein